MARVSAQTQWGLSACTDVLVLGGGPAGGWPAITAAEAGRRVILVDKGYFGTSGATAPSNTGTWCIPPGDARRHAVERRAAQTGGLSVNRRILQVLDASYAGLRNLLERGYPFPTDEAGQPYIANLRGPDYMRFLRRCALKAGVKVLDHSPALELLSGPDGVGGATGIDRRTQESWRIEAGAVVLATGGCAFGERILGAAGLTGDATLMAAEVGAELSGMEFVGQYGIAPAGTSLNKGLVYRWASFFDADGHRLEENGNRHITIAKALSRGPVFAVLDQADAQIQDWLRRGQANILLPHDRAGIDPFKQKFEITLRCEGTIRGIGGIRLVDDDCATGVSGLFAAGDAASREDLTGAASGGGGPNASWAIATGKWAGRAASIYAARHRATNERRLTGQGRVGLRSGLAQGAYEDVWRAVREEILPVEHSFFRSEERLTASQARLDGLWADHGPAPLSRDFLKAREAAALLANARWSVSSSRLRKETRGIHRRLDYEFSNSAWAKRIILSGVDNIHLRSQPMIHDLTLAQAGVAS